MFYQAFHLYETDYVNQVPEYSMMEKCENILYEAANNKEAEESFYRWFNKQKITNPRLYKKLLQVTIYVCEIHVVSIEGDLPKPLGEVVYKWEAEKSANDIFWENYFKKERENKGKLKC